MGENSVYIYDETSPLEQSQRNVLHYLSTPQETTAYLVELPSSTSKLAPPPQYQAQPRSRNSTIISTYQMPETVEDEKEPLESYIRKNLPSFRRSVTPGYLSEIFHEQDHPGKYRGGIVVTPVEAGHPESDLIPDTKKEEVNVNSRNSEMVSKQEEISPPIEVHDLYSKEKSLIQPRQENKKRKSRHARFSDEVTVMATLTDYTSVSQQSPFTSRHIEKERRPSSRVRVMIMVDSDDEFEDRPKHSRKYYESGDEHERHLKTKDAVNVYSSYSHDITGKHKSNSEDGEESIWPSMEYYSKMVNPNVKMMRSSRSRSGKDQLRYSKSNPDEAQRNKGSKDNDRPSNNKRQSEREGGLKCSLENRERPHSDRSIIDNSSEEDRKQRKRPDGKVTSKSKGNDSDNEDDKERDRRDGKASSKGIGNDGSENESIYKNYDRQVKDKNDHTKQKDKHNRQGDGKTNNKSLSVGRYLTQDDKTQMEQSTPKDETKFKKPPSGERKDDAIAKPYKDKHNKARDGDRPERRVAEGYQRQVQDKPANVITLKAPKSATKMYYKKRYHIQIPEKGRPETWFNARFNINDENTVAMNYEGPVKITNYYTTYKYT